MAEESWRQHHHDFTEVKLILIPAVADGPPGLRLCLHPDDLHPLLTAQDGLCVSLHHPGLPPGGAGQDRTPGWSTLIGRAPSRLCSDWLDHNVADTCTFMP